MGELQCRVDTGALHMPRYHFQTLYFLFSIQSQETIKSIFLRVLLEDSKWRITVSCWWPFQVQSSWIRKVLHYCLSLLKYFLSWHLHVLIHWSECLPMLLRYLQHICTQEHWTTFSHWPNGCHGLYWLSLLSHSFLLI